jgi:hypothetical protein
MQKHITREIEAAANAQLGTAADAVSAAIQFVRTVAEEHAAHRTMAGLKLPFEAERKAAVVDDAISSVAESSAAEYVRQIARGAGPAERQQFSLGNQLTWNAWRALPQFLHEGKPILLTDPEQVARWDRLAKQEVRENAPGPMAQIFKARRESAPTHIAAELEELAEGKIIFQSADRLGWDKVIYYRAGEKGAAERLAEILRNSKELTEQQQAEVWRLEGWPEADVSRELERMRHVQRMHDESWWTPPPSLTERARQYVKNLLSFSRGKEIVQIPAKAEPEQAQRSLREIQRSPKLAAEPAQSAFAHVERGTEAEGVAGKAAMPRPNGALLPSKIAVFHQPGVKAAEPPDLDRARANSDEKTSAGGLQKDEPIFRWLDAAVDEVHRYTQSQPRSLQRKR